MPIKDFIENLDKTTTEILQIAKTCSPDQLTFKQDDQWNILEILEHLYITDRIIYTLIARPSDALSPSTEIIGKEKMKKILVDRRDQKIISPEALRPKGTFKDLNEFEKAFRAHRDTLKQEISTGKIPVDNRVHKHLFLGEMTITDWLHFMIHHTQRHIDQVKDLVEQTKVVQNTGR